MSAGLRRMTEGDLEAVLAIAAASPEAPRWQRAEYARFAEGAEETNPHVVRAGWVAGVGAVVGFACVTLLLDGEENRAELETLAVAPGARRQGVGAALVSGALAWAAAQGGRRLALEVRASNGAALGLYGRMGFRCEGRRTGYYADPEEDALVLVTSVTEAGAPSGFFH